MYLDEKGLELHLSNGNKGYYNFSSPKQMEELEARIGHHGMKPLNFFVRNPSGMLSCVCYID